MIVRPTSVEGFYYDSKDTEFALAEWQAFSRAIVRAAAEIGRRMP